MTSASSSPPAPQARRWRVVDGIVLLDKPQGLSSTQALQRVRRLLQAAKAGHAGTLDPLATGMLPLCFGQATKACGQLLGQRKAYRATVQLGVATATGDAEGEIIARADVPAFTGADLERVLAGLRGERPQVPPMYSALKRDGRPLYELARRGETVARPARSIRIDALEATARSEDRLDLEVTCSKGTYVRVLAEEIAAGLGTHGHLVSLRRLWVDPFEGLPMVTLAQVEGEVAAGLAEALTSGAGPDWLLAVDRAFPTLPAVQLDAVQTLHLRQGRTLERLPHWSPAPVVRAYDPTGAFLGLVEAAPEGRLRVQRLFVAGAG